jgi:hypothetical protein
MPTGKLLVRPEGMEAAGCPEKLKGLSDTNR